MAAYAFGPFVLDTHAQRLRRDGALVDVPAQQMSLLLRLVARPGEFVSKNELIAAVWQQNVVEENTLARAVVRLRRCLDATEPRAYISSALNRGYRFHAHLQPVAEPSPTPMANPLALLDPFRAFVDGRALLETFDRDQLPQAHDRFAHAVAADPTSAANHVGLAVALFLRYETSRADARRDDEALAEAARHGQEACRLNPQHAEALATLALILDRQGLPVDAVAAARRAVALEPRNWRHRIRLSWVSWGEERLAAARDTRLLVSHPFADLLCATVGIARFEFADAERDVDAGLVNQADRVTVRYGVVALDLLKGLLCLARGADVEGRAALLREVGNVASGHIYAREFAAHAHYAIGAADYHAGHHDRAAAAFQEAVRLVPLHAMAHAGLASIDPTLAPAGAASVTAGSVIAAAATTAPATAASVDIAAARAVVLSVRGDVDAAVTLLAAALTAAPQGSAGWMIPLDPMLRVYRAPETWRRVLRLLVTRAL